jgi:hypothetical protein
VRILLIAVAVVAFFGIIVYWDVLQATGKGSHQVDNLIYIPIILILLPAGQSYWDGQTWHNGTLGV